MKRVVVDLPEPGAPSNTIYKKCWRRDAIWSSCSPSSLWGFSDSMAAGQRRSLAPGRDLMRAKRNSGKTVVAQSSLDEIQVAINIWGK